MAGDDVLMGGAGDDVISGGDGNDTVFLGAGDDFAMTGDGDDVIHMGDGADMVVGGAGADTAVFDGPAGDYVIETINGTTFVRHADGETDVLREVEVLRFDDRDVFVAETVVVQPPQEQKKEEDIYARPVMTSAEMLAMAAALGVAAVAATEESSACELGLLPSGRTGPERTANRTAFPERTGPGVTRTWCSEQGIPALTVPWPRLPPMARGWMSLRRTVRTRARGPTASALPGSEQPQKAAMTSWPLRNLKPGRKIRTARS